MYLVCADEEHPTTTLGDDEDKENCDPAANSMKAIVKKALFELNKDNLEESATKIALRVVTDSALKSCRLDHDIVCSVVEAIFVHAIENDANLSLYAALCRHLKEILNSHPTTCVLEDDGYEVHPDLTIFESGLAGYTSAMTSHCLEMRETCDTSHKRWMTSLCFFGELYCADVLSLRWIRPAISRLGSYARNAKRRNRAVELIEGSILLLYVVSLKTDSSVDDKECFAMLLEDIDYYVSGLKAVMPHRTLLMLAVSSARSCTLHQQFVCAN